MRPIELINLPNFIENIDIYADGLSGKLINKAMIKDAKLHIPFLEVMGRLDNDIKVAFLNAKTVQVVTDSAEYYIMPQQILKRSGQQNDILDYDVTFLEDDLYIDALFLVNELDMVVAFEKITCSVYICSVFHYDGYRKAPASIFNKSKVNQKYHHRFMYVDGVVVNRADSFILVQTMDGQIIFTKPGEFFKDNGSYRFCFCYLADSYKGNIPMLRVMECCAPIEGNTRGKMQYTTSNWAGIQELLGEGGQEAVKAAPKKISVQNRTETAEEIKDVLEKRSQSWITPALKENREMEEITYKIPGEWRSKPSYYYKGYYYYPYEENEEGIVWVSYTRNITGIIGEDFAYNGLIAGMVRCDFDRLIVAEDIVIDGLKGKKVSLYVNVDRKEMISDCYIVPTKEHVYIFHFGEKTVLSNELKAFEEEFMNEVIINMI